MEKAVVAQYKPYCVEVQSGKRYLWCACGLSKRQPFCDGSHVGTAFKPVRYVADQTASVLFCGCKQTGDVPFCDGTHNNLVDDYESDSRPIEELLAATEKVTPSDNGRAELDGNCYVQKVKGLEYTDYNDMKVAPVINAEGGSRWLDQYYIELAPGTSPPLAVADADAEVVLFGLDGESQVNISGHREILYPQSGMYIRKGEAFAVENNGQIGSHMLATVCPGGRPFQELPVMPQQFDASLPRRGVVRDDGKGTSMADRSYQILVGEKTGCDAISQFIGKVPQSKAAPHRHLYEEAIIVLSGEGIMWTETRRTAVGPGDVIFLPAKQQHSLECTTPEGMALAAHIYPAGSPAINY